MPLTGEAKKLYMRDYHRRIKEGTFKPKQIRVGDKFGKLTIISFGNYISPRNRRWCTCICECGNQTKARVEKLENGRKKSCGCIQKERIAATKIHQAELDKTRDLRKQQTEAHRLKRDEEKELSRQRRIERHKHRVPWWKPGVTSFTSRFNWALKRALDLEKIPETDPLNSFHFYCELIRDGICHYCEGPLPKSGHGLDRMDNDLPHVGFNVVPCCGFCNHLFGDEVSYEEKIMLAPVCKEIRIRRSLGE